MNKAYYYLLPLLGRPTAFYHEALINAYLGEFPTEEGVTSTKLILEFNKQFLESPVYDAIKQFLISHDSYKNKYSQQDKIFYVFHTTFINEFDLDKFKDGAYSKLSAEFKKNLSKFYSKDSNIFKSLFPTKESRKKLEDILGEPLPPDAEIMSKPNLDKEVINTEQFITQETDILL